MTTTVVTTGVEGFVGALEQFGCSPVVECGLVVYTVVPVSGGCANREVRTGVKVDEVAPWPVAPPHWIHLSAEVEFVSTNASESPRAGWRSHSRDVPTWGSAQMPIAAWLAHVRGVLGGAT